MSDLGAWSLPLAVFGGAIRVGTPYLYVSLGECLTEKSGRVNLGLEGTLVMGAMSGYAISYKTGSPWMGVLAAGCVGALFGAIHALICNRPRVNSVAVGIAMMVFGIGLAAYLGKPYIQPSAPQLPSFELGAWSSISQVQSALKINALFIIGLLLAPAMAWMLKNTRWGMVVRLVGENTAAATAMGYSINRTRLLATTFGGVFAGVAGSYLSLYYPGAWTESISSGQGLMAVALVIFARWNPINCLWGSLLIGGAGSIGLALQSVGLATAAAGYLWNAAPYILTLVIMVISCSRARALAGAPAELGMVS
jgi:simple sugar transport system permease protein